MLVGLLGKFVVGRITACEHNNIETASEVGMWLRLTSQARQLLLNKIDIHFSLALYRGRNNGLYEVGGMLQAS